MKLTLKGITENREEWLSKGYRLPEFDIPAMVQKTKEAPEWVHFGGGNIFRAFHANLMQDLLNQGLSETGIIVCEGYDYEIAEKMYRPHDNLSILATLRASGSVEKTVIGSIAESCELDSENAAEFGRMREIFAKESLSMATFTITEKGYSLTNAMGELLPPVAYDLANGPEKPQSYIGKVASLLYTRFVTCRKPIAMVSTDNCSHNGDKLAAAMHAFAEAWEKAGLAEKGFTAWVDEPSQVSFPWSMIDKITPRPASSVEAMLRADDLDGLDPVVTTKGTHVAPFVNAEESQYLVIEDKFPNGRPALEKAGVIFTERETVDKVEKMKVCTCLNPLHTSMAVFGCVLGYDKMSEEMKDPDIKALVQGVGYVEGLPDVVDPGIIDPKSFIDTVVNIRIPNPFMPDTPQRIATDTSQKLAIRFGETIKAYKKREDLDQTTLNLIPLVFAGWVRYLLALDDNGEAFNLSDDPLLPEVKPFVEGIKLDGSLTKEAAEEKLHDLLANDKIFGVNLYEVGLADKVLTNIVKLCAAPGAVRKTLHEAVK